jgi:hypothetical protein
MADEREERCELCRFWESDDQFDPGEGLCRRYPPALIAFGSTPATGRFPSTAAEDWCGEFQPQRQPQSASLENATRTAQLSRLPLPSFLTADDVRSRLFLTTIEVKRLAKENKIPHFQLPNGELRFDRADLLAWIESCKRQPGNPS